MGNQYYSRETERCRCYSQCKWQTPLRDIFEGPGASWSTVRNIFCGTSVLIDYSQWLILVWCEHCDGIALNILLQQWLVDHFHQWCNWSNLSTNKILPYPKYDAKRCNKMALLVWCWLVDQTERGHVKIGCQARAEGRKEGSHFTFYTQDCPSPLPKVS